MGNQQCGNVRVNLGWSMGQIIFEADDFKGAKSIELKRGTCLIYEGDMHDKYAYFLLSGSVEVQTECYDGTQTLLYTLQAGVLFGELVLMGAQERIASIYTVEKSKLLKISPVLWKNCLQNPDFLRRIHEMQLQRYLETTKAVSRLGQSSVLHRLGTYFMTLPNWHNTQKTSIQVVLPSHNQLGRMLNSTRERVTVVMQEFYKSGAVMKQSDGSYVLSRPHLAGLLRDGIPHE